MTLLAAVAHSMRDDLNKAEVRWRNKRLFRPERRRWGRLVLLALFAAILAAVIYQAGGVRQVVDWLQIAGGQ